MIYTVTFNPSLDYVVRVTDFELGNLHRTEAEELFVGGKGINVSAVLHQLGVHNMALGFVAGFTGNEIVQKLNLMGVSSDFIYVNQGISRINIKLKTGKAIETAVEAKLVNETKTATDTEAKLVIETETPIETIIETIIETDINGCGPAIRQEDLEKLYDKLNRLKDGDILILSGSIPQTLGEKDMIYSNICQLVIKKNVKLVVDAEGDLLINTLRFRPFLIKPNHHELGKIFGLTLTTKESIISHALLLREMGAQNILVSMAEEGAILIDQYGNVDSLSAPKGKVLNSVGAGDSMVAGFLAGFLKGNNYNEALKMGVAAGSAASFTMGLPKGETIREIYNQMIK